MFHAEVLPRLGPTYLALFGRVGGACRAAVVASGLPRAGTAAGGRLDVIKFVKSVPLLAWAKAKDCPWNEATCQDAARGGHLDVLKWAREHDCPWASGTCYFAAQYGHLEVLRWARDNGCPCPDLCTLLGFTATSGNVEMATWFRVQGCPWYAYYCALAAAHGHLEFMMWLREHGCPADLDWCTDRATRGGHIEVVEWLGQFTVETRHTTN